MLKAAKKLFDKIYYGRNTTLNRILKANKTLELENAYVLEKHKNARYKDELRKAEKMLASSTDARERELLTQMIDNLKMILKAQEIDLPAMRREISRRRAEDTAARVTAPLYNELGE